MTAPVEARSLSSLTNLLANPPQYPRNPTHKVLDQLVLYIVRVPGSEDIFLTPLKPPTKASITAEAIQSSLYYFHVPTAQDESVKELCEGESRLYDTEQGNRIPAIPRKPLSSSLFTEPSDKEHPQAIRKRYSISSVPSTESDEATQARRQFERATRAPSRSFDEYNTIARKPVGPRPFGLSSKTETSRAIHRKPVGGLEEDEYHMQSVSTKLLSQAHSSKFLGDTRVKDKRDAVGTNYVHTSIANIASDRAPSITSLPSRPSKVDTDDAIRKDLRVIIIRRDPTSGSQWNVGSLSREQRPDFMDGESVRIEITSPGYQRFARQPKLQPPAGQALQRATEEHEVGSKPADVSTFPENDSPTAEELALPSTSFQPKHFTRDLTLNRQPPSHRLNSSWHHHRRSSSSESFPFPPSKPTRPSSPNALTQLTFLSPWQGICTFATGMDGRSLRCRHKLPSSSPGQTDNSALIADLRFNLPWSALRSRNANASAPVGGKIPNSLVTLGEDAKHGLKRGMARIRQELQATSSSNRRNRTGPSTSPAELTSPSPSASTSLAHDDESDSSTSSAGRLDLSLGRERAGGGRKGKNAKLGKLVLKDEGLKMADLVVAACMGVWWDVYWGKAGSRV